MSMRWAVADSWTLTRRDLLHWARQPGPVAVSLLFPVLLVLMFGYLFGGAISVPGGGNYREYLMPGMFGLTMLFGIEGTMVAVTTDAARGVTDRFRSMPMMPGAVLVGRCLADMLNSVAGLGVMMACGLLVGWRSHGSPQATLVAIGLLLLLRLAVLWVGIYLGLLAKSPESVVTVQILVWPVAFLASTFVDPGTMPAWLGATAEWNPLSATISTARHLFGNPGGDNDTLLALAWPAILLVIFVPLAIRRYQHR